MPIYLRTATIALVAISMVSLREPPSASAAPLTRASTPARLSSEATPLGYVDPPPIVVHRFYLYATMQMRRNKSVTIESLVSTSSSALAAGDLALLSRKIERPSPDGFDWAPVADVVVKKLLPKGRIELEIQVEHAEASVKRKGRIPFAAGEKVRLQVDRSAPPTK